jgi:hypothetical protein
MRKSLHSLPILLAIAAAALPMTASAQQSGRQVAG